MKDYIICKSPHKGKTSFYLISGEKEYYLFTQNYRKGVEKYFLPGVLINNALDITKAKHDHAIIRTKEKLPIHIKYIENEYRIPFLKQTKKKMSKSNKQSRTNAFIKLDTSFNLSKYKEAVNW